MTKFDLIQAVASQCSVDTKIVTKVLKTALETIKGELAKGGSVGILGFGTFAVKHRKARQVLNPQTGETLEIPAHKAPHFKAGKTLRSAVIG